MKPLNLRWILLLGAVAAASGNLIAQPVIVAGASLLKDNDLVKVVPQHPTGANGLSSP